MLLAAGGMQGSGRREEAEAFPAGRYESLRLRLCFDKAFWWIESFWNPSL